MSAHQLSAENPLPSSLAAALMGDWRARDDEGEYWEVLAAR
jgi:hypothetical protein